MASYQAPQGRQTGTFNSSDFNFQDNILSYSEVVKLSDDQIISGKKTFLSSTTFNEITNNGSTYLQDMTIAGNTIIGDESSDTLRIKCQTTSIEGDVNITGTFQSTTLDTLKSDVVDLSTNIVNINTNITDHQELLGNTMNLTGDQSLIDHKTFNNDVTILGTLNLPPRSILNGRLQENVALTSGDTISWQNPQIFTQDVTMDDTTIFNKSITANSKAFFNDDTELSNIIISGTIDLPDNSIATSALQSDIAVKTGSLQVWDNTQLFKQNMDITSKLTVMGDTILTDVSSVNLSVRDSITLPERSINELALPTNVALQGKPNIFTETNQIKNLIILETITVPDKSFPLSKIDGKVPNLDLVNLYTNLNQFSRPHADDSELTDDLIGKTQIYGGSLTCEAAVNDNNNSGTNIMFDSHYLTADGLYNCYCHRLIVPQMILASFITATEINCNSINFGSQVKVKSLNNLGFVEGVTGSIDFGDDDTTNKGSIERVNNVDSVSLEFSSTLNEMTLEQFNFLDQTSSVQDQLDTKSTINSPTLTGIPKVPLAATDNNTNQIASTKFVKNVVADLVNGASETLDTLNELASAINDDPNFSTTMANLIGTKVAQSAYDTKQTAQDNSISTIENATSNIDNTSDANKPISSASQTALNLKANQSSITNVNNTSDANKPISSATQTAINLKANQSSITNINNTSDDDKPISSASQTALDLKFNNTEGTSNHVISMQEKVLPLNVNNNDILTVNMALQTVAYITPDSADKFETRITNSNPSNSSTTTSIITLIIDTDTYKSYSDKVRVNGTIRSLLFSGGEDSIDITDAKVVQQTIVIIYSGSSTIPKCILSSISPYE